MNWGSCAPPDVLKREMKIRTSIVIRATPETLWPLLTNSSMDVPGCFCLGLPQPVSCELPDGVGGIGSERRCISDRGVVVQRITEWAPPKHLQFEMVSTNHCWSTQVDSIREEFRVKQHIHGSRITRTTTIAATKPFRCIKELGFYLGLKRVHLYVFKNWQAGTESGPLE
ncbi:MAG: SRPBCC family protein [Akkermansiaceae bacterium]|nr:SRPBCC family protein [Akkermansiaceae bacterium]